jgi:thiamine biosynthesis lipoprotein
MLSLGGNVQVLGDKPDGSRWNVAIQDPFGDGYAAVVSVEDQAVVTSGGYQRYFEQDGVRYWHILDPATGAPARSGLVSVTIVGTSGVLADCLSTALFVMGREQAADYWRARRDFDFVLIGEDGSVTISQGLQDTFSLYGDWAGQNVEVIS